MREAFLCVLVHPDGRTEFRIFGERNPTKHFDTLCAVLAEARSHDFEQAVRGVKRFARAQGLARNPQLAAFLDEDDRHVSEMTGATIGSDGIVRRQDGEPVVFPRASHEKPPDGISVVARLKSGEYIEGSVASGFFIVYGRAPTPVTEIVWWAKSYRTQEETSPPTGDALARGTAVHEHIERLLTVVEKAREVDRKEFAGDSFKSLREALANLDAHGDVA